MGSVRIDRLDHLVLTVADIDATVVFYTWSLWWCSSAGQVPWAEIWLRKVSMWFQNCSVAWALAC